MANTVRKYSQFTFPHRAITIRVIKRHKDDTAIMPTPCFCAKEDHAMKPRSVAFIILVAFLLNIRICTAQTNDSLGGKDLTRFSQSQLEASFDNSKVCGSTSIDEIGDELVRRLPKLPSAALVSCFDDWTICGTGEGLANGWPISDELAHRGHIRSLLVRYWLEPKKSIRGGIEHVAYHFDTPEVTEFMRRVVAQKLDDGEQRYWPVNYLAKKCDTTALHQLSSGRYRN